MAAAWSWPFAARVRAASCPFLPSFPRGRGILGGRLGAAAAGDVLSHPLGSRRGGCRSALPPTPLVRCNRPHLRGHPHPTATHLPARPAHPCAPAYGAPDEPEVVAPLAEASLAVVLIELALVEFSCVGAAGQWWAGASIGAGAMRSECVHDRAPAYGWLQAVGSDVVPGACMRCVGCGGHSHYYESSEQLVIQ